MRNFLKMGEGIDVYPLLYAIHRQPEVWNAHSTRKAHYRSIHIGLDDITLRYNKFDQGGDYVEQVCSEIQCVNYPAFAQLPEAIPLVFQLMNRVQGEHLGRVLIAKMNPGTIIPTHNDIIPEATEAFPNKIAPALYYDRYHIVLKSNPGVIFKAGDEQVYMATGEVWWFDNTQEHEVINNSADDRIHLIVDIRSHKYDNYIPTGVVERLP